MLPDIPSQTENKMQQLLSAYRSAPSPTLQRQLVDLNLALIDEVIAEINSPIDLSDKELFAVGTQGLIQALEKFDPEQEQNFNSFATSVIQNHLQNFLAEFSSFNQLEPLTNVNSDHVLDKPSSQACPSDSNSGKQDKLKYHSFRLSEEDTQYLQNLVQSLEKRSFKNFTEDDSPSGPLKAETLELLQVYRAQPSARLRNCLVQLNIGLVRKEAYHWVNQCSEAYEDLVQIGAIGLIRAIERFDLERGHAFSSFAVPYIRGEIQHYLRDKSSTVRIPRRWLVVYNQGCKVINRLRIELRREPVDLEIATLMNISVSEWQEIKLACQNRSPLSLDAPVHEDEEGASFLGDLVPDAKYRSFQLAQEDSLRLQQALCHLEDRTREIVEFVFLKEFTHREVAEILGISAVTVSRQVKKGLTILRKIMTTPID